MGDPAIRPEASQQGDLQIEWQAGEVPLERRAGFSAALGTTSR